MREEIKQGKKGKGRGNGNRTWGVEGKERESWEGDVLMMRFQLV